MKIDYEKDEYRGFRSIGRVVIGSFRLYGVRL